MDRDGVAKELVAVAKLLTAAWPKKVKEGGLRSKMGLSEDKPLEDQASASDVVKFFNSTDDDGRGKVMFAVNSNKDKAFWKQVGSALKKQSKEGAARELVEVAKLLTSAQDFEHGDYIYQYHKEEPSYARVIEKQKNGGYKVVTVGGWSGTRPAIKSTKGWHPQPTLIDKSKIPPKFLKAIAKKFPS